MTVYVKKGTVIRTESMIMEDLNYIVIDWKTAMQTQMKIVWSYSARLDTTELVELSVWEEAILS